MILIHMKKMARNLLSRLIRKRGKINMIQLVLVLIVNTLFLMAWGRVLKNMDVFKENKNIEHQVFRFVMTGNILSMILIFIIYPFWQSIVPGFRSSTFISGSFEEALRFLIFIAMAFSLKSIKEPRDGIILAASVALGFALGDNFNYAFNSSLKVFIYKSFFGTIGHITYALIWGSIFSVMLSTTDRTVKSTSLFYAVPALTVSILLHGTYNSLLVIGQHWYALFVVLLTSILFFTVYKYVKEISAIKKYPVNGYRSAVPGLQIGGR
jgi:RsiW-degrading membrane proteinase PrsW (M82 family)